MKLIVISYPEKFHNEESVINALFRSGVDIFHLRKPEASIDEMRSILDSISSEYHNRVVLHSHHKLIKEYNLRALHFRASDRALVKEYSSYRRTTSAHSIEELNGLSGFDYILLSPIFNSISKLGYSSNFTFEYLHRSISNRDKNIIALGGISIDNIDSETVKLFDGVALLGAVWSGGDPVENFLTIKREISNVDTTIL